MPVQPFIRKHSLSAATVALCGLAVWRLGLSPELPAVLAFIFGGMLLAAIDWRVHRLPTKIVYSTMAGVAGGLVFASVVGRDWPSLLTAVAGALLFTNAFFLVWALTTKFAGIHLLGFGDVRLAAVLGLLLGWYSLPHVLYGALVGHALALVIAVATCVRKRELHLTYSFGPPLIAGTLAVVLFQA